MYYGQTVDDIRQELRQAVRQVTPPALTILPWKDKWVLASALQKAIRRGDAALAMRCADTMLSLDMSMLLRRLQGTALEDVGIGDLEAVTQAIVVTVDVNWLHRLGGVRETLWYVISRLSEAPKERSADYLLSITQHDPALAGLRTDFADAPMLDLLGCLGNKNASIESRALAMWYAIGTDRLPGTNLATRKGDPAAVRYTLECLGAPSVLLEAGKLAWRRMRNPFPAFVPLLVTVVTPGMATVQENTLPPPDFINGIPLYALGGHTRPGKAALREFVNKCLPMRKFLEQHVPEIKWGEAIHVSTFHAEAALCQRHIIWSLGQELRNRAIGIDLVQAGVAVENQEAALDLLIHTCTELNLLRQRLALAGAYHFQN